MAFGCTTNILYLSTYYCLTLKPWLHVKQNYFETISKLFQCFISHITMSETEIKLFQPVKF